MKHLLLTLLLSTVSASLSAQSLRIYRGQVCVAVPADEAGDMTYADGQTLSVLGQTYDLSSVDSIVVSAEDVAAASVGVTYADNVARIIVSADIYPQLTITATGANVSIVAGSELQEEVTYTLSGASSNGSFYMDGSYKATVAFAGLTLTNTQGAAVTIDDGKRIAIVVSDGTVNTLADATGGTQKACFFVNGHPEFSGAGTLILTGNTKHAFASDEYTLLKKNFGTLQVLAAASDGLHVGQYFRMKGGTLSISGTKGDGIDVSATKDADDELNGQVLIENGQIAIDVAADDVKGIKCDSLMTLSGGSVTANVSGNGSKGISVGTNLLVDQSSGNATSISMSVTGTTYMPDDPDLESKCRGIKVKGDFTFDGGNISISATGKKAKAISVDGNYYYKSGTIDCAVSAANT